METYASRKWGVRDRSLSNDLDNDNDTDNDPRPSRSPSHPDNDTSPSRITRPSSSRSSASRRPRQMPVTLDQAFKLATEKITAEKQLAAQGSPSPAPRPRRQDNATADRRPLQNMIPDKPIDFGRLGAMGTRRARTSGFKEFDFQTEAHKDPERKREFARDMMDIREGMRVGDEILFKEMNDKNKGPPSRRRTPINGGYTSKFASRQAGATNPSNGNGVVSFGNRQRDEPRQTFANFAETGTAPSDWLQRFGGDGKAAMDFRAKVSPSPAPNEQRKSPRQQNGGTSLDQKSPVPAGQSVGQQPFAGKNFGWQVDDEFTAGDLQVSTSPPVNFGRTNTKIDEIKQAEMEAEHDFAITKPRFLERTNTKIDEIRRLEQQYALADIDAESAHAGSEEDLIKDLQHGLEAPRRPTPRFDANFDGRSQEKEDYGGLDGEKVPNTPVTIYKNGARNELASEARDDVRPDHLDKKPSPASEDSHNLLRRLARASSKSPSPSPAQENVDSKPEEKKAEAAPASNDKATFDDQDIKVNGGGLAGDKASSASKPSVGFKGVSRRSSSNSAASKNSVASHDPTARIQAEAKLFALDGPSERGSLRAPSPRPRSDSEMDNQDDEDTPQPTKFSNPITMPTPRITGAYIDTPAPVKVEERGVEEDHASPSSRFLSPEKALSRTRRASASPRASRLEGQRGTERPRSSSDLRRTRSTSRRRAPLKNSVKPPTVQEDLRQICLKNEIDDSELDDLTGLIMSSADPEKFIKILKNDDPKAEEDLDDQLKRLNGMSESLRTGLAGIRTAKRGIERLEGQVSRPEKQSDFATNTISGQPVLQQTDTDAYTYVKVPVPKLWRAGNKAKLTLAGWVLLLLSLWQLYWIAEDLFYDQWGKQTICYRGSPCRWKPDDPEYGYVIPVKLDEWVTGGAIRPHAAHWLEEAQDGWADFHDWLTDTDIRNVHHQSIRDSTKREQYWRRIEKKGLFPKWNPDPAVIPVIEAWEREATARETAEARAAMGYDASEELDNETGSMTEDQPIVVHSRDGPPGSWW